ncbi:hypothetical protein DFQ29_008971 [Apophysomyces sp. BC1021]|nr:hypothetical protein DFQ29_008971 [Apophysomyces sp. BC1021]
MSILTNDRLAYEDSTESMDLTKLLAENADKPIVFGGTDYGIVTTSCTALQDTSSDDEDTDMAGMEPHVEDTKLPNT